MKLEIKKFNPDDRVIVISECNSKGDMGTVVQYNAQSTSYSARYVGVRLDNGEYKSYNENSLKRTNINKEDIKMVVGDYKIAIVNLEDDYYKKDYGFYLYDDVKVGDTVVVNPNNKFALGKIKALKTQEEYGKNVTKDVVGIVNMDTYKKRVEERNKAIELAKQRKEIQRELDAKISKLKDLEFYERMAKELGERDPEIAVMVDKLKKLNK
jgi:hypothetical protein